MNIENEIQKKKIIEAIKNIRVGIVYFEYGDSMKENSAYDVFTVYNKKIKIISDRAFTKISKKEYDEGEVANLIKKEYDIRDVLKNSKERWYSIQELWENFERNNINIISFEIEELSFVR